MSMRTPQNPGNDSNLCYPIRVSELGYLYLISAGDASVVQFGDRAEVNASLRALAVQRESDHESKNDVYFEAYSIYNRPRQVFPEKPGSAEEDDDVQMTTCHRQPAIRVGCIQIIAISAAANILIGNGMTETAESRIKNIRQFAEPLPSPGLPEAPP